MYPGKYSGKVNRNPNFDGHFEGVSVKIDRTFVRLLKWSENGPLILNKCK